MGFNKRLVNLNYQWLNPLVIFFVSLLAYIAVLVMGIPSLINLVFSSDDSTFLYIALVLLLYLAYRPSGWLGTLTSFSGTLILFAVQLSELWGSGASNSLFIRAGLLPISDAHHYYSGALELLEGGRLSVIASRRPLFSGMLATLLGLTQQNIQVTVALLVLINAIACFFLAREVQRSHGTAAGVLVLTTIFLFYREFIGSVMTENLGLALGAVGLAILWRGAANQRLNLCLLGILILTLALNARAGAFFLLPALILWGAWSFRCSSRFSQSFLFGGVSVLLLGFILNSLVFKVVSSPHAGANSNFAYTLYGLIVGGNWTTIFTDHPEINSLSDIEKGKRVYSLTLEALCANPLSLLSGSMRAWKQFLFNGFVFSFVRSAIINLSLQILSLVALVNCYRQRQTPIGSLTIAATIGILVSIPFVPPWDAGTRIYAATIPFFSLLPALGFTFIAQKMKWHPLVRVPYQNQQPRILLIFGMCLVILTVGGPITTRIVTKIGSHQLQLADNSCPVGTEVVYFRHSHGSSINLVADNAIEKTYVPNIRISDFRAGLYQYQKRYFPALQPQKQLVSLNPHTTLINKFNFKTHTNTWIIADSSLIPKEKGIVVACGKESSLGLFYADSMKVVSPR